MTNDIARDDVKQVERWENEGGRVGGLVRRNSESIKRLKRRYRKFAWIFGTSAFVIMLLYWEQAAVLYVLSTLAICAVLLVVMFSNLEARDKELHQAALQKMDVQPPKKEAA